MDSDEIQDPALRFDRWAHDSLYGGRRAGTERNNALPSAYYQRERGWRLKNALKALSAKRLHDLRTEGLLNG